MCVAALIGGVVLREVYISEQRPQPLTIQDFIQAQDIPFTTGPTSFPANRQNTSVILPGKYQGEDFIWFPSKDTGDFVNFEIQGFKPGPYLLEIHFAASRDFGIVEVRLNDRLIGTSIDLFTLNRDAPPPIRLYNVDIADNNNLHIGITGTNRSSFPPHYQFGIDGIVIRAL